MLLFSIPPQGTERWRKILARTCELLREGEVIYFPTDTLPGLLAWVLRDDAVRCVFKAKGRPSGEPLPIGVGGFKQMLEILDVPEGVLRALEEFIPGPLTIVGPVRDDCELPEGVRKGREVAVRVPGYPPLLEVLREVQPLTLTSANLHGQDPMFNPREAMSVLGRHVKYYFADYRHRYMKRPSTVIRLRNGSFEVLREGAIDVKTLKERLHGEGNS